MNRRHFLKTAGGISGLGLIKAKAQLPIVPLQILSKLSGNQLLTSLTHHWNMDSAPSNTLLDDVNSATMAAFNCSFGSDLTITSNGIINSCVTSTGGTGTCGMALTQAWTDALADTAKSFTLQVWAFVGASQISTNVAWASMTSGNPAGVYWSLQYNKTSGKFTWIYYDSTGTPINLLFSTVPSTNAWHHIVAGVDIANAQTFMFMDNSAKQTASMINGPRPQGTASTLVFFNQNPAVGDPVGRGDEYATWMKALTSTDVSNLWNGGAALPKSSYTN